MLRRSAVLGMVVDWGYRPDDVPVRLFGAWTTLPAGPATLAARTRAAILPVAADKQPDGTLPRRDLRAHRGGRRSPPRSVATRPRPSPTRWSVVRAGARPVVHLQAHVAGHRGRGGRARAAGAGDAGRRRADGGRPSASQPAPSLGAAHRRTGCSSLGVGLLQRLPDRPVYRLAFQLGKGLSLRDAGASRRCVRANLGARLPWPRRAGMADAAGAAAARDGGALDALVRDVFGHWVLTYVESAMRAALRPPTPAGPRRA